MMARKLHEKAAYHTLSSVRKKNDMSGFRNAYSDMFEALDCVGKVYGNSRELSLAITKLEESQMWLNKAISISDVEEE